MMVAEENKGGIPHVLRKSIDFVSFMDECSMFDLWYTYNPFTWSNGRRGMKRITKRLDKVFINDD